MRLTAEVEQVLQQRAIDSGRSLSAEADAWLRRALGLNPGRPSPAAERNMVDPPTAPAQVITPPQGRGVEVPRLHLGSGPRR